MKLLLDTHALLWFAAGDRRLSAAARQAIEAEDAIVCVSAASVWELAVRTSLGPLRLPGTVEAYMLEKMAEGYQLLPVTWSHAAAVERLPFHHRDPFDRLLAVHALAERCALVTRDRVFRRYGVDVVW